MARPRVMKRYRSHIPTGISDTITTGLSVRRPCLHWPIPTALAACLVFRLSCFALPLGMFLCSLHNHLHVIAICQTSRATQGQERLRLACIGPLQGVWPTSL